MRYKILLVLTILLHYGVFVAFLLTALLAFHVTVWYIALSLEAFIFRIIFDNMTTCPLTTLENLLIRYIMVDKEVGYLLASRGFMKDYLLRPSRRLKELKRILLR